MRPLPQDVGDDEGPQDEDVGAAGDDGEPVVVRVLGNNDFDAYKYEKIDVKILNPFFYLSCNAGPVGARAEQDQANDGQELK